MSNKKQQIDSLTSEQEALIPEYIRVWTEKGLTTKRCSLDDAKIDFYNFQKHILKMDKPAPVIMADSPKKCWEYVILASSVEFPIVTGNELDALSTEQKNKILDANKEVQFIWPYFDCQFWAGWFAFYEFFRKELGIVFDNEIEYKYFLACQPYGMVFPLENICVVCQPPTQIHQNASGLHNSNGPAVSYNGDNEVYALNGVVMSKEYVMTPANQISTQTILKESNVEIRRELIRKVGIEAVINSLPHKVLDKKDNYELYSLKLSENVKNAKYLKMTNPSIGVFHVEGVAPEINTVDEALSWRNGNRFATAEVLT